MNGHAAPMENANFKIPSVPDSQLPQKDPQFVRIDEKGSSFGRFSVSNCMNLPENPEKFGQLKLCSNHSVTFK